jgi:muramoyltetrapeptide carboxypeptidase
MATDAGYGLGAAIAHIRGRLGIPVIEGLPFGHQRHKATLPVGATASLQVRADRARLLFKGYPHLR